MKMAIAEETPLATEIVKVKKKSFKEKIREIKENVTIEPVLACFVLPGVLSKLATQNLNLEKACRVNLKIRDSVCTALIAKKGTKYKNEEVVVQKVIAGMETWSNLLQSAIPSFLILFIGAWSDRTKKRKICILLPVVGEMLTCVGSMLNVYFFYELPVEVAMFLDAFIPAITGGWVTTYMGAFSYICDHSDEESRTLRVGMANLCLTACAPLGTVLGGFLMEYTGYYGIFSVCTLLYFISIVYGFVYIKDPVKLRDEKYEKKPFSLVGFFKDFFNVNHIKDTLTVALKSGPNHRRTKSILILIAVVFIHGPYSGEQQVRYLFTRYRFQWDLLKYSFFCTLSTCTHILGAFISISLVINRWKCHDSILGLISNVSKVVGAVTTALATTGTQMYISVALESFNATSFTALRSLSSKLCNSDELGKMISVFNLMEVLTSMVFSPTYSWTYLKTVEINAGIVFYISAVVTILPLAIFGWFYHQSKKEKHASIELERNKTNDCDLANIDVNNKKISE